MVCLGSNFGALRIGCVGRTVELTEEGCRGGALGTRVRGEGIGEEDNVVGKPPGERGERKMEMRELDEKDGAAMVLMEQSDGTTSERPSLQPSLQHLLQPLGPTCFPPIPIG